MVQSPFRTAAMICSEMRLFLPLKIAKGVCFKLKTQFLKVLYAHPTHSCSQLQHFLNSTSSIKGLHRTIAQLFDWPSDVMFVKNIHILCALKANAHAILHMIGHRAADYEITIFYF
uniref:Uncharacterized protein n=1 Tax=Anguilla anguilla TaxID=7936 RepID=A0A0E9PHR3_ANGAN